VIVAKKVQQPMKREHAKLGLLRMPRLARLTPRCEFRDDDIA
jgi:hypothetical protein